MRGSITGNAVATPRHTFLLDDQCKFQLDNINTSDLTASCVSVCSSDALRKWRKEISSSVARSNFVSNLMKTQQKLTKKIEKGLWRACSIKDTGF